MSRFSRSFQQDAPTKLQITPTDLFVKVHELRLPCGSLKEFFTPCKHLISSSGTQFESEKSVVRRRRVFRSGFFMVSGL